MVATSPLYVFQDKISSDNNGNQQQQPPPQQRSSRTGIGRNKQTKKTTKRRNTGAGAGGSGNSGIATTTATTKDTKKPITKSIKKSIRNQIQRIKKSASSSSKGSIGRAVTTKKGRGKGARDIVDVNDGILYPPHTTSSVGVVKKKTTTTRPKGSKKSTSSIKDAATTSTSQSPSKAKKTTKKKSSAVAVAVIPSPQSSSMKKKKAVTSGITKQDQPKPMKTKKSKKKTSAPITTSAVAVKLKRSRGKEKSHHNRYNKSLFSQSSTYDDDDDDYSSFDNDKGSSFFSGDSDDGSGGSSSGSSSSSNSDGGNDDDDSDSSSLYDGLESFVSSDDDDDNNSSAGSDDDSGDSVSSSEGSSSSYCSSEDDVRTKTERGASFRNPSASIVGTTNSRSQSRRGRSRNPRPRVESLVTVASATASVASTAALISSPRRNQPKPKQKQRPSYDDSDSDVVSNSDDSSYISEGTSYDDSDDGSKSQSEYYTTSYDSDRNNNTTFDDTDRDDTDREDIEHKRHHHLPSSTFGSEETERTNLTSSNFIKRRGGVSSDGMITDTRSRDSITVINDFTMSNDNDDDDNDDAINGVEEEDETNTLPAASFSTFGSTEEDQKEFEAFVKDQNEIEKIELDLKRLLAEKRQEEFSVILKIKQQKEQKEKEIADADAADDNTSTVSGWGSWIFSGFGGGSLPPTIAEPVGAGAGDNDVVGILGSYKKGSDNNNETTTPVSPSSSSAMVAKKNIDEEKTASTTIRSPRRKGANVKDFNDGDNDDDENSIAVRDDRRTTFSAFDSNTNGRNTTYIAFDNGMMNRQQHQQEGELENAVTSAGCGCDMNHILDGEESIAESYGGLRNGEFLLSNHTDSFSQQDQHEQEQRNDDGDNNNDIVEQLSVTMIGSATFDDEDDENEGNDNANNNTPQEISFAPKKEKNSNDSKRVIATTEADDNANDGEDDTSSFSYCCFTSNQDPPTLIRKEQLLTGAQTKPEGRADGVDGLFSSSVTLGQEFERRTSKYGGIDNNNNNMNVNSNSSNNNNNNIDAVSTLGGDDYYEEDDATCASTINTQAYYSQELFKDMKTNTADVQRPSSRLELASAAAETIVTNGELGDGPTGGAEESDHFVMIPVDTDDYKDDNEDDSICAEDIEIELGSCGGGHDINDEIDVDVSDKADSDNSNNSPTRRRIQAECLENYDVSEIVHGRRAFKSKKNEDGSLISTTLPSTNPSERRARRQSALKAHRDFLYGSYSKDTFVDIPADKDSPTAEENKDVMSNTKGDDGGESYAAEDDSKATAVPDGSGDHQQQHETTSIIPSVNDKGGNSSDLTTHTNSILQDDATLPADDSKPDALMELVRNAFTVMMSPDGNTAAAAATISATPHHKSAPKTEYVNDNDTDAGSTDGVQGKESTINTASSNSAENAWGVAYNFFGTKKNETPLISESRNDLEDEEDGALKCNDYNPSPVTRPTPIHSEASEPISATSGDVVKIPSDIPFKMSNSSAPSNNITKESHDITKISDEQILATDSSPKATQVSRSSTKNNNARFNSDGIPLQLSPKKIWRAFDSGFVASSLSTANTEATSLPMSDFLYSPVIVEENKTTNDDNVKQKDQEDTSSTPADDVRSLKKKVSTEKKSTEDEPAKRKLSSRYRKHSDLLRMKNRRLHKNNKSPEIQWHSNNCSESPQEEEKAATERHNETKSPSNQQRSQNRSPTKERPQSKELVVSKDDKCYTKTNDETSEIATQTATEDELAASPSETKPSSSPRHNLADIRSRIKQRRRTKMFSKSNYHHQPQKEESNNNATKSSSPSTSPLKLRSSTSKNTSKSKAVTTNNTKTSKTKSRIESRNDSDASKDHDHDEFYDALTFDDDDINNDGAPDNERGGDDVTTTEQHHLSLSSKDTNPNVVILPLVIPEDQERDFSAINYKESILSSVMSLD